MCEPHHSIVQFPTEDNDGNNNSGRIMLGVGKAMDWAKKIKNWFHFSKMGAGHSEAIEITGARSLFIPDDTKYEASWWDRGFHIDGAYCGHKFDESTALAAARQYADSVSIGSLHGVRQFLEKSLMKTDRHYSYLSKFIHGMLNKKGRDKVIKKLHYVDGVNFKPLDHGHSWERLEPGVLDKVVKIILGATRQRELLCPAWSEDSKLWLPQ